MTTKIKNSISLPSGLRKMWRGSRVFIRGSRDMLVVKRVRKAESSVLRRKLKDAGKRVTARDIAAAIRAVRG